MCCGILCHREDHGSRNSCSKETSFGSTTLTFFRQSRVSRVMSDEKARGARLVDSFTSGVNVICLAN